jgi:hypothetical protein
MKGIAKAGESARGERIKGSINERERGRGLEAGKMNEKGWSRGEVNNVAKREDAKKQTRIGQGQEKEKQAQRQHTATTSDERSARRIEAQRKKKERKNKEKKKEQRKERTEERKKKEGI